MSISYRRATREDYDGICALWNSSEQSRRALNPVDDSRDVFARYLGRNPATCFVAVSKDGSGDAEEIVGVILCGHDGWRGIVHHLYVHPACRREGIASTLVQKAEKAIRAEGISNVFGLVFTDNDAANAFWEAQGYTLRMNVNYRNKSLNADVPQG